MFARRRVHRPLVTLSLCAVFVPVACSDDPKPKVETTVATVATIELPPPTTAKPAPTTTTTSTTSTTVVEETTTTVPVIPTYPLTGVPLPFGVVADGPAMVVKIDNHPAARPQSGLNEADIVFEENVEQLTRFALVFHSNGTDPVGPIRSGRTQDIDLLGSFNRPLFVWSGGNRRVTEAILASDLREISPSAGGPFFRTNRPGPYDLYANMTELYALAPALTPPDSPPVSAAPAEQFEYRADGDQLTGEPIAATKISMDGVRVLWQWDPATERFLRFSDDKVHKDTVLDAQVDTQNVIVVFVDYRPSPADGRSPEAQTIGTGEVWVYTAGTLVVGTWTRADRLASFALTDSSGTVIALTPGRTFVELARTGKAVTVPDGTDTVAVPYP